MTSTNPLICCRRSWLLFTRSKYITLDTNKGNNKITEHRAIFQRERQNS